MVINSFCLGEIWFIAYASKAIVYNLKFQTPVFCGKKCKKKLINKKTCENGAQFLNLTRNIRKYWTCYELDKERIPSSSIIMWGPRLLLTRRELPSFPNGYCILTYHTFNSSTFPNAFGSLTLQSRHMAPNQQGITRRTIFRIGLSDEDKVFRESLCLPTCELR